MVLDAFAQYDAGARIQTVQDPNVVYDLPGKPDKGGIMLRQRVEDPSRHCPPIKRLPTIANLYFLTDMGRMRGESRWEAEKRVADRQQGRRTQDRRNLLDGRSPRPSWFSPAAESCPAPRARLECVQHGRDLGGQSLRAS